VVGSPTIPTASNLTRTSVRELIDGFAERLFGWLVGKVLPDGLQIGAARSPALLNLNGEVLAASCLQQTRIRDRVRQLLLPY